MDDDWGYPQLWKPPFVDSENLAVALATCLFVFQNMLVKVTVYEARLLGFYTFFKAIQTKKDSGIHLIPER